MSKYSFAFETPEHLLDKLQRELARLEAAVKQKDRWKASDHAFNFVVTAWSLCDWIHALGRTPKKFNNVGSFQNWIKEQSEDMLICSELANGSKHFRLGKRNPKTEGTIAENKFKHHDGILRSPISDVIRPVIHSPLESADGVNVLRLEVLTVSGNSTDTAIYFDSIIEFWRDYLEANR